MCCPALPAPQIDTGDDMPAIAGALASLAAGRVRVLTFKYGGVGLWGSSKLEDVVSRMDELSYACYFSGGWNEGAEQSASWQSGPLVLQRCRTCPTARCWAAVLC